jgi:hypothetical protein
MNTPRATVADVEALLRTYAEYRRPEELGPPKLLRRLHHDINQVISPALVSLDGRSEEAYSALVAIARWSAEANKKDTDEIMREHDHSKVAFGKIVQEIDQITRELDVLPPDSPKRKQLVDALQVRDTEMEFARRRLEAGSQRISSSIERTSRLMPDVAKVQATIQVLKATVTKALFRLLFWDLSAKLIILVPTLIALFTILAFDRFTPVIELLAEKVALRQGHDIVLLILFGIQVLALTPATEALNNKLCRRHCGRTVDAIRSLASEMGVAEAQIVEAEQGITLLSNKVAQS